MIAALVRILFRLGLWRLLVMKVFFASIELHLLSALVASYPARNAGKMSKVLGLKVVTQASVFRSLTFDVGVLRLVISMDWVFFAAVFYEAFRVAPFKEAVFEQ